MRKPGRPTKFSPEARERILQAISMGAPWELAPLAARVSYPTFRNWMRRGEKETRGEYHEFFEAVKEAEGRALLKSLAFLEKAAQDGVWTAAAWKLERRYPQFFARTRVEITGKDGKAIEQKVKTDSPVAPPSLDDLIKRIRALHETGQIALPLGPSPDVNASGSVAG